MQKRTKRTRKIKVSSIIFPGRMMISSYWKKDFCASTALYKQGIRSDWKSDLLGSELPTSRRYSNTGIKKEIAPRNSSNFLKIGTPVCSPYPTRQMSKSWHTLDGVFPRNKGKAKSHFSCIMQWVPVTNRFNELINSWWQSQHTTSVLIIIMTEFKIVLDFRTNKKIIK